MRSCILWNSTDFSIKMCRNSILLTSPSSTNCKAVGVLSSYNALLSRFQPPHISNKWVSWWECFCLIQIQTNTPLKRRLALDGLRFLNLSECGVLTYSLKPSTHADSLNRFFSKRKSGGNWQMSERLAIVSHGVHFHERLFELTQWDTAFTASEKVHTDYDGKKERKKERKKEERKKEERKKERKKGYFPMQQPFGFLHFLQS